MHETSQLNGLHPQQGRRLKYEQNVKETNGCWKGMDMKACGLLVACVSLDIKKCLMMRIMRQMVLFESGTSAVEPPGKDQVLIPKARGI